MAIKYSFLNVFQGRRERNFREFNGEAFGVEAGHQHAGGIKREPLEHVLQIHHSALLRQMIKKRNKPFLHFIVGDFRQKPVEPRIIDHRLTKFSLVPPRLPIRIENPITQNFKHFPELSPFWKIREITAHNVVHIGRISGA